jgi:beta-galactosidase
MMMLGVALCGYAQPRVEKTMSDGWQFSRDGNHWETVRVPHDWAISGPFDKKWDLQVVAIEQNGEKVATEKSGRSGALPWIGEGQYKCSFEVPHGYAHAELLFDGAMSEPVVYINGHEAGHWAYGYNCFRVDATPYLNKGNKPNEVWVKLRNVEESSRWYPGAGIYRPVKLICTQNTRIDDWGTFVRTSRIEGERAWVDVDLQVATDRQSMADLAAEVALIDARGRTVVAGHDDVGEDGRVAMQLVMNKAQLWTPETPHLYQVVVSLYQNHQLIDEQRFKTGIRTIRVSKEKGFELNGVSRKIQGVCLHHDLGPLGAAVNKAALTRQILLMKEMGADAIRTSHNMPSQMQMELCDSLGMMVMAESFDMWIYPKCKNGYARFFKEWSDKDIERLVRAHRNHPSIVMWSIGNEIPEQWSEEGRQISEHLQDICHRLDPTRPVTQGLDKAEEALKSGFAQVMDVPGFNYRVHKYPANIRQLPKGFLLGSETASTVSSRGFYRFPVKETVSIPYKDGQCSSYDTENCSWSNLPEDDFIAQEDLSYTIGQFVWTGFDYLGEPTPYDEYWPSRSSYFGICDLAGLPKDRYYLYRSVWNRDSHTIHLLPHWTWPGRGGKVTPVYCYTDYPSAELFVNGVSQGRRTKDKNQKLDRYRLRWNDVVYQPGELRVVVYDQEGRAAGEEIIRTAGKPDHLLLEADKTVLCADGEDMTFVTVSMVDRMGNLVPDADHSLTFEVEGQGVFQAACNGDAKSLEPFTQPRMKLFNGKLVVVVRSTSCPGEITLRVIAEKQKMEQTLHFSSK